MGNHRVASHLCILGPSLLLVGVLLFGCDRPPSPPDPRVTPVESTPQALSATTVPSTAATSLSPGTPGKDSLDEFEQALLHKVDRSRWRGPGAHRTPNKLPATPEGGILHFPDGEDVHVAILVKNPDGTVRRECISSSAEVSALVEEIRKGGAR